MLYSVKYNNSIPFFEEQSCQANKVLIDGCNRGFVFLQGVPPTGGEGETMVTP